MIQWLAKHWRSRLRQTDLSILWPICKSQGKTIHQARAAFYMHVINDDAWTKDYSSEDLIHFVDELS